MTKTLTVRACSVDDLRKHRTAITAEGMLYQGYVARALAPKLMDDTFIGKKAIEERKQVLAKEIHSLEQTLAEINSSEKPVSEARQREYLFNARFLSESLEDMPANYRRLEEIKGEYEDIKTAYAKLEKKGLLRIQEELAEVETQLDKAREDKEKCGVSRGICKDRIHVLEYDVLPGHYQAQQEKLDFLNERFTQNYQEEIGNPRYKEERKQGKKARSIHKNFGDRLEQTKKEYDGTRRELVIRRRDYINSYPPCPFIPDTMDNNDFQRELSTLREVQLPQYREKIRNARESAMEQFQNDFLAKLKSNIDSVQTQVRDLNRAIGKAEFGNDKYYFIVKTHPDYIEYHNMIMDPDLMENNDGLSSLSFQNRYGALIENLFSQIVASDDQELNSRKQSELLKNIERYTDYRTYLDFDLETTDQNGNSQLLSQTLNSKSGGETQTPFYIAILASFAQIYRVHDKTNFGNTVRLAVFDEAFNKMDSDRIVECIKLLRKMGLQAIFSTPPEKLPDIMPEADKTILVMKKKYQMHLLPWSKSIEREALVDG